jgi:hypothetical protein
MIAAANVTKGCMNIACIEPRMLRAIEKPEPYSQNRFQPLNWED